MAVEFRLISESHWRAFSNGKKLADIYEMENGRWKPWTRLANCNATDLRAIADKLDELNGVKG